MQLNSPPAIVQADAWCIGCHGRIGERRKELLLRLIADPRTGAADFEQHCIAGVVRWGIG